MEPIERTPSHEPRRVGGARAVISALTCGVALACGGPTISTIRVRFVGTAGLEPVPAEMVQIVRGPEVRPHRVIAELEVPTDGSTFEILSERLRRRAGDLGCDVICDLRSVFDVGTSEMPQTPGPPRPDRVDMMKDATALGVGLLLRSPTWVSVRATAVLLDSGPMDAAASRMPGIGESSGVAPHEVHDVVRAPTRPPSPPESKPVDKP
jgi:hypothetical protein